MLRNGLTLLASAALSLALLELVLMGVGRYEGVIEGTPSDTTIWDRPRNATQYAEHPDLGIPVANVYDADGVRNHSGTPASQQRAVYGFFGDSFTENRQVPDEFTFTTILRRLIPEVSPVNYGVAGFGVDQAYLRYKRYASHDLQAVFYVFCGNDFRNLYETRLFEADGRGGIRFVGVRRNRALELLGRFRTTYLLIELAFTVRHFGRPEAVNEDVAGTYLRNKAEAGEHRERLHDDYGDAMRRKLLSPDASEREEVEPTRRLFRAILQQWKADLDAAGIPFHVVVLPRAADSRVARALLDGMDLDVLFLEEKLGSASYSDYRFARDAHWNEAGNIFAAVEISRLLPRTLTAGDPRIAALKAEVAELYAANGEDRRGGDARGSVEPR